jgi:inorganic triphosphatase YgiF
MTGETESTEIELKLVLPAETAVSAVIACLRENNYRVEELEPVRQADIYLDTFDWALLKNRVSLRYRVSNGRPMYTLKSMGPVEGGIARRMETEVPLDKPIEAPALIPVKQVRSLVAGTIFPRRLLEQVLIRTDRLRYRVTSPEGAEIELAFDSSGFSLRGLHRPRRAQRLNELEAEILTGPDTVLGALASLLSNRFHYSPSSASKFEVALERFKIAIPSKKPPERLTVRSDDRLDLAVRKILTHQFFWFREHLPGLLQDIDTEFVHQARVATRRMRSCLGLFRGAVPEGINHYLRGELKWLGTLLGAVRDLDVFLLNLSRIHGKIESFPAKKRRAFENWVSKHRRAPLKKLCEGLESPRFRNFERRFLQFLEKPLPRKPRLPLALKPVREVAPAIITEKFDAVMEEGRRLLAKPKLKQYHLLRIQMKRLRYAAEFMASAYNGTLDPFIEKTVKIQDCLGELQDTVFTRKFIDGLIEDWKGKLVDPDLLFILGEIYQLQSEIASQRREIFGKLWEEFISEETVNQLKNVLSPIHSSPSEACLREAASAKAGGGQG